MREGPWAADEDAKLKSLYGKHTYTQLGIILHRKRNSIASRCRALKLSTPQGVRIPKVEKPERRKRPSTYLSKGAVRVRMIEAAPVEENIPEVGSAFAFGGVGMSLLTAPGRACRWPFDGHGDDGMPRCCGREPDEGSPYCPMHRKASKRTGGPYQTVNYNVMRKFA